MWRSLFWQRWPSRQSKVHKSCLQKLLRSFKPTETAGEKYVGFKVKSENTHWSNDQCDAWHLPSLCGYTGGSLLLPFLLPTGDENLNPKTSSQANQFLSSSGGLEAPFEITPSSLPTVWLWHRNLFRASDTKLRLNWLWRSHALSFLYALVAQAPSFDCAEGSTAAPSCRLWNKAFGIRELLRVGALGISMWQECQSRLRMGLWEFAVAEDHRPSQWLPHETNVPLLISI